ncbi:Synaptotagmin-9 [Galemys pyrenaicus]|uniref:Synaptotagmin-9 n=1 Tax=Galemys pyrenaicus TaxID=202257 RepID=A0A8J5ZYP9_GALPY|nr:Synaptotagmin-9 [Galemys pyrenaicus]
MEALCPQIQCDPVWSRDPYVKVSLMCDGRRLKKRKTSTKRNTLNPVYNEAIVFDVPPENIDQIHLSIAVMDYDRVGHNEIIGVCQVGNAAERLGRDHWSEMLSYPRKPIAHWHSLVETIITDCCWVLCRRTSPHVNSLVSLALRGLEAPAIECLAWEVLAGLGTGSLSHLLEPSEDFSANIVTSFPYPLAIPGHVGIAGGLVTLQASSNPQSCVAVYTVP